jgi:hypothetical protein
MMEGANCPFHSPQQRNHPVKIIYSDQSDNFIPGVSYENPHYFSFPTFSATEVLVIGEWPAVVHAYEAIGIPVSVQEIDLPRLPLSSVAPEPSPSPSPAPEHAPEHAPEPANLV